MNSEPKGPYNTEFPVHTSRGHLGDIPEEQSTKPQPDNLTGERPQSSKVEPPSVFQDDILPDTMGHSQTAKLSSVKRTFSDVEKSPEPLQTQTKKCNSEYKRCCEIPEEVARFHTGLTGTFSTVTLDDVRHFSEGRELVEEKVLKHTSPIAVAKNLFCELEEPGEDVFVDGARDLSNSSLTSTFSEDRDICRSLSLDSDGSMHETSLTVDSQASLKPSHCSKDRNSSSFEEMEEIKDSALSESLTHSPVAVSTETPKLGSSVRRGEFQCFGLNRQSPSFLRPKNVVAFRSYCSSINRSNMSCTSHLSIGSVDAMETSMSASCHTVPAAVTPVQRRPRSSSSLYEVGAQILNFIVFSCLCRHWGEGFVSLLCFSIPHSKGLVGGFFFSDTNI